MTTGTRATDLSLLETALDATNEGILAVDSAGKITLSNRRFAELWGIPSALITRGSDDELLAFVLDQVIHPDRFIERIREVYEDPDRITSDVLEFRDGRVVMRSSRPQKLRGETTGVVWSFRDITEQRRAETERVEAFAKAIAARAEAERERMRAEILSDASRLLAESLDFETTVRTILEINITHLGDWSALGVREGENGMRLLGFRANPPEPELSAKITNAILDATASSGIPKVIRTGKPVFAPIVGDEDLTTEGGRLPIVGTRDAEILAAVRRIGLRSFMIVPLELRGKVIGAMSIARSKPDLPFGPEDSRLAEELARRSAIALDSALLYRDALRTIRMREDFLSVASHELRAPLSPLRMQFEMAHLFAKMIPESFPKAKELIELMDGASQQVTRLLKLVDNLLDVSRITAGRLTLYNEWFDLPALVREVVLRMAPSLAKAGCEAVFDFPERLEWFGDPSRIDQVITNLVSNALKFGAGRPIRLAIAEAPGEVRITVRDEGGGVLPEERTRIFERFERGASATKDSGFGLGLFITREIISAHAGRIAVESIPGQGATFVVRLPTRSRLN